ncbi:hypothetical protein R3P38DRAFT_2543765 [Favolaschia claudopus]|uniref:MYND-type domain-containing protein n=1 Tax=Favolaschia claudopus TaxID=2862362 RepID=A0AAW0AQ09_9AGAR
MRKLPQRTYPSSLAVCSQCLITERAHGRPLRECSQVCHSARYCTKECQAKDWPQHKNSCEEAARSIPTKLMSLSTHPLLSILMSACCVMGLNIRNDRDTVNNISHATFSIGVEPADILDLSPVVEQGTAGFTQTKVKGVIQLNAFDGDTGDVAAKRKEMWIKQRSQLDAFGCSQCSIVIVDVFHSSAHSGVCFPMTISNAILSFVKQLVSGGFELHCKTTGEMRRLPCTIDTCMEIINNCIRNDTRNKLHLRTPMQLHDLKTISTALSSRSEHGECAVPAAAKLFLEKMDRESVYHCFSRDK